MEGFLWESEAFFGGLREMSKVSNELQAYEILNANLHKRF